MIHKTESFRIFSSVKSQLSFDWFMENTQNSDECYSESISRYRIFFLEKDVDSSKLEQRKVATFSYWPIQRVEINSANFKNFFFTLS